MISWRARHRLITVLSIVAVIAGVFFAGYALFRAEPSCSDNLKNQNELGVDCGGGCERVCREEVVEMQIFGLIHTRLALAIMMLLLLSKIPIRRLAYENLTIILNYTTRMVC